MIVAACEAILCVRVDFFFAHIKRHKGGEDEVEVTAVLEITRAEEGCPQQSVGEDPLADCLGDRQLASPGEPVQPEDGGIVKISSPQLNLV